MGNLKTVSPEDNRRTITGQLRILSERKKNPYLVPVELWLLNDRTNRNNWRYENLEEHKNLFEDTPILVAYKGEKIGDKHNFEIRKDEEGKEYASFLAPDAERIVGWFPQKSEIRTESKDGLLWIVGKGFLWVWYARELVDTIVAQGGSGMDVSIETLIDVMRKEGSTEVFEKYTILGTTILGLDVAPAVAGAHIRTLSGEQLKELKIRAASYEGERSNGKSNNKKGVKKAMSKTTVAQVQKLFPEHRVLAVSEDGMNVCLLAKNGTAAKYTFVSKDDMAAVVPERIESVNACALFDFGADNSVSVDVNDITDALVADLVTANAGKAEAESKLAKADERICEMEKAEKTRRVEAAKKAVRAKLAELNANRKADEKFDEKICDEICKAADEGEFTECANENGEWCGESKATEKLMAKCMAEQSKLDAKLNSASEKSFAWEIGASKEQVKMTGIEGAVARINEN